MEEIITSSVRTVFSGNPDIVNKIQPERFEHVINEISTHLHQLLSTQVDAHGGRQSFNSKLPVLVQPGTAISMAADNRLKAKLKQYGITPTTADLINRHLVHILQQIDINNKQDEKKGITIKPNG